MVCALHKEHRPASLTIELHHVIPRAWQAAFVPVKAPYPGTYGGLPLWDARTVPVAPTCHRNVHWWIVRLMHGTASTRATPERATAQLALERFAAAGGNLDTLRSAGLWGEA